MIIKTHKKLSVNDVKLQKHKHIHKQTCRLRTDRQTQRQFIRSLEHTTTDCLCQCYEALL